MSAITEERKHVKKCIQYYLFPGNFDAIKGTVSYMPIVEIKNKPPL